MQKPQVKPAVLHKKRREENEKEENEILNLSDYIVPQRF